MIKNLIKTIIIISLQFAFFNNVKAKDFQKNENSQSIAVIINSELYSQVKASIDQYLEDLENEGHNVLFSTWDYSANPNVEDLKALLQGYHRSSNLVGAVLIGKLPYAERAEWEYLSPGVSLLNKYPFESYLMDLNNEHFIKNSDGETIESKSRIILDIWVSRICAPKDKKLFENESEADLIANYFKKNHEYRTCKSPVPDLKLKFFADNELGDTLIGKISEYVNSWIYFYQYLVESGYSKEYLDFVKNNPAQYLYVKSHSSFDTHTFTFSEEQLINSRDMKYAHIKQPFILLNGCSACNFLESTSLGNAYLFGSNSSALVIAGLTFPGNLLDIQLQHNTGKDFGSNALSNFNLKGKTTRDSIINTCIFVITSLLYQVKPHTPFGIALKTTFELASVLPFAYNWQLFYDTKNYREELSFAFTLLGDPTLSDYANMDWCPENKVKEE